MNDAREWIDELVEELKEERDKLRVRVHLAKMEADEEWEELDKLELKAKAIGKATAESAEDVTEAVKLLGTEIKDGFKHIASQL